MTANGEEEFRPHARSNGSGSEPSVHQLRLFMILAEELHFGRSASRLFMSQPAFSKQIRVLERRLGLQLVERTSRIVELTPSGLALLPHARAVTEAMANLRHVAEVRSRENSGRIVVGTLAAEPAMPHTRLILDELHRLQPHLAIEMRSLNFINQYEALACGEVDVAFLRPPAPSGIQAHQLAEEPRLVCLPDGDPLAVQERLTLAELSDRTMVTMPPESPQVWRDFWAINPRPNGIPIRFGPLAVDVEGVLQAIARNQAIGFLPASARDFYPRPGIVYRELVDAPPCTMALTWFARNRDRPHVALMRKIARTAPP
ncbi:LysR family transcriptional regulator [Streptomyces glebosus]|uniref:LysR family transcriptional regulator n=1 Tax=Streptomyces glebosus TaxID=249580 RepID=A0A640T474_9ACTN|nr:LysR substrate-binding domain-containing protein [Streptomyces glebosus]GFE17990.1 LysR family transcriptional regulator [Streptomyces glebosus]GHG46704.1 LysR family transcriptional regulator [Streptomyces glebosus]